MGTVEGPLAGVAATGRGRTGFGSASGSGVWCGTKGLYRTFREALVETVIVITVYTPASMVRAHDVLGPNQD